MPDQPLAGGSSRRPPYRGPGGFLLLDKPAGISSFQALRPVKRAFPKAKVGHAGTLDPAASGLLIAGVGSATRLLEYLEGMSKTYAFTAHFGFVSDTYDLEGRVEASPGHGPADAVSAERIERALAAFRGRIRQVPPAYSAIKVGGERAYALARAGGTVELEAREVEVSALEMKAFRPARPKTSAAEGQAPVPAAGAADATPDPGAADPAQAPSAEFVMTCSKGTYVRSVVHDLGRALGCGAVTGGLRRLAIGPFRVEAASAPDVIDGGSALLPPESALAAMPKVAIPRGDEARFRNGQTVTVALPPAAAGGRAIPAGPDAADSAPVPAGSGAPMPGSGAPAAVEVRAHAEDGRLLAIALLSPDGRCSPRKVLAGEAGA